MAPVLWICWFKLF